MMKKILLTFVIISVIICCISACSDKGNVFNFKLDWVVEGSNGIDTYERTLTRGIRGGITETMDFAVSDDKMQEFYEAFLEYEIYDLPEDVTGKEPNYSPTTYYTFTYTYNKETKTITCDGLDWDLLKYNTDTMPPKLEATEYTPHTRFIVFVDMIREYIYSTEEWQNLLSESN